eukprot:TRINITY_DN783_c0_g1_i1.p1 TRINITY_DN783_c0_g1~~TRINITY_DN783_c0_g1_i1.p1  ORF type:complete len:265 (-),score=35.37 TRINITY_DN783_c0_g1_i1:59-853(-)
MEKKCLEPKELRQMIRNGQWSNPTSGICGGYVQANVVILDKRYAKEFEEFCNLNPAPCPIIEIFKAGCKESKLAPGSDIVTDVPKYRIFESGKEDFKEETSIEKYFNEDMVTFLIGCSFSFEDRLIQGGVPVRNIEQKKNVSMFRTKKECKSSGHFSCNMVVTYRPIPHTLVEKAKQITIECKAVHGPPLDEQDPNALGIKDLHCPDFGEPVKAETGDVPVFWPCGVTCIEAVTSARKLQGFPLVITHSPGHMFVTDSKEFGYK